MSPEPSRHALVWIDASAPWIALGDSSCERLRAWLHADRPAVAARLQGDEPAGFLRLGIALPPSLGKKRLGYAAPRSAIKQVRDALALREVVDAFPGEWQDAAHDLLDIATAIGLEPRVYGSFAWQALTGDRYIGPTSDIDLLWRPRSKEQLHSLTAALLRWERATGRRADGEVVLPSGEAVCWRELASGSTRVLVKSACWVALRERSDFLVGLA